LFIATSQAMSKPVQFSSPMDVIDTLSMLTGLDAFAVHVWSKIGSNKRAAHERTKGNFSKFVDNSQVNILLSPMRLCLPSLILLLELL